MKQVRLCFYLLCLLICCIGCSKPINSKAELIDYINEPNHGLQQTLEIGKVRADVTFKPWQLIAANLYSKNKGDSARVLNAIKNRYYFVLGFSENNKELLRQLPYDKYSEIVKIFAFRMMPYVSIITDKGKVVEAEDCLFQQTYGMAKENEMLLVFERDKLATASTLDIKVKEFGLNIGDLTFQVDINDIKKIPPIKFSLL